MAHLKAVMVCLNVVGAISWRSARLPLRHTALPRATVGIIGAAEQIVQRHAEEIGSGLQNSDRIKVDPVLKRRRSIRSELHIQPFVPFKGVIIGFAVKILNCLTKLLHRLTCGAAALTKAGPQFLQLGDSGRVLRLLCQLLLPFLLLGVGLNSSNSLAQQRAGGLAGPKLRTLSATRALAIMDAVAVFGDICKLCTNLIVRAAASTNGARDFV